MSNAAEGGLPAVTAILLVLLIATVFGRIHGQEGQLGPIGDRVISGLLALPLIIFWVKLVFPEVRIWWALAAAVPLAIYVVLLSFTDVSEDENSKNGFGYENLRNDSFTWYLLVIIGAVYFCFVVAAVLQSVGFFGGEKQ